MRPFHCPKCGLEQPRANQECPSCQIVFAKWIQKEFGPKAETTSRTTYETTVSFDIPVDKLKAALSKGLIGTAILLVVWEVLAPPRGLPVPAGAYVDKSYGFAVTPPEGWTAEAGGPARDSGAEALTLTAPATQGGLPAVVKVFVSPLWARKVRRNIRERFANMVSAVFPGRFSSYGQDITDTLKVDRLETYRFWGVASQEVRTSQTVWQAPPRAYGVRASAQPAMIPVAQDSVEGRPVKFAIHVVPGADRTYLVGVCAEASEFESQMKAFETVIGSFRVIQRPYSFTHLRRMLEGQLREELIMAFLGLIFAFYKWVFSPLLE